MMSANKWIRVFFEQSMGESTRRIDIPERFRYNITPEDARKLSLQLSGKSHVARFMFHFVLMDILDRYWKNSPSEKRCKEIFTIKVENGFARFVTPDYPRTRPYSDFFPSDSERASDANV